MTRRIATTKMTSRGQIVIPEEFRKKMGLEPGAQFLVLSEGDALIFKTIAPPPKKDINKLLANVRKQVKDAGIDQSEVKKAVKAVRQKSKKRK